MGEEHSPEDHALLKEIRRRRSELRDSMGALELALAAPAPAGRTEHWVGRVRAALHELSGDFRQHVAVTEGKNGLYQDLLRTAPRLSGPVARLTEDHAVINERLEVVLTLVESPAASEDVAQVRDLGTALLGRIVRHRQQGADLVYEAYEVDVGGGED
jgi:hypothetical protein